MTKAVALTIKVFGKAIVTVELDAVVVIGLALIKTGDVVSQPHGPDPHPVPTVSVIKPTGYSY